MRVLQWLLIIAAVVGGGWLALLAFGVLRPVARAADARDGRLPGPDAVVAGRDALGVLLALVCRVLVSMTARSVARAADKRLREAISTVSEELVVQPVQAELAAYSSARSGLDVALR